MQVQLLSSAQIAIHKDDTLVFVAQKAFIQRTNKVLVMRDPDCVSDQEVGLDFPGGKYRYPNDISDELTREVTEETGLAIEIGKPFTVWTAKYREKNIKKFIWLDFCANTYPVK